MPTSAASQRALGRDAADAINSAKIPGVVAAGEMYGSVLVEVTSTSWQSEPCDVLEAVARSALQGSRGTLLPIDVRVRGRASRSAVTVVDGGRSMRWEILR